MKKYLLLITAVLALSNCSDILHPETSGARGKVLVEVFGFAECPNCPAAEKAADDLYGIYGDSVFVLEYHCQVGSSHDTLSPPGAMERCSWYNISSYPVGIFDGTGRVTGGGPNVLNEYVNQVELKIYDRENYKLNLENKLGTGAGTLSVVIDSEDTAVSRNYSLFSILTEDSVMHDGEVYNHTVRYFISGVKGIRVSEGDSLQIAYPVKNFWNTDKMEIITFLQDTVSKNVDAVKSLGLSGIQLPDYEFIVNAPDTVITVNQGDEGVFDFTLENIGLLDDIYNLKVEEVGTFPRGWSVFLCYSGKCDASGFPYNVFDSLKSGMSDTTIAIHVDTDSVSNMGVLDFSIKSTGDTTLQEKYRLEVNTQ